MADSQKPVLGIGTVIEAGKQRWRVVAIRGRGVEFIEIKRGKAEPLTITLEFSAVEKLVGAARAA